MNELRTIKSLIPLLRLHKWRFAGIVALGLLQSLSEGVGIGLLIPLLSGLVAGPQLRPQGRWLIGKLGSLFQGVPPEHRLTVIVVCVFGAVLANAILSYANHLLLGWEDGSIAHDLRRRIFRQLLNVHFGSIERDGSGRLLNLLASDSWRVRDALGTVVGLMITTSTVAVYVALLLMMSWKLTVVVAVAILIISSIVRLLTKSARELGQMVMRTNSDMAHRMVEGIDGMRVIRAFGRESYEQGRFDATSNRLRRVMLRMSVLDGIVHPVYEVLAASLVLIILLVAAPNASDSSVLLVFAFVLYRIQPRVKQFDSARVQLAALSTSVEEVLSFLDTHDKVYTTSGTAKELSPASGIAFDQVSFHYAAGDDLALAEVSFRIPAGQTTAFVGPSGGGKSTVMKLILRFYEPDRGSIRVGDGNLAELDVKFWRDQIAVVSQDVYLFDATVRENIAYGRLDARPEEIIEAARKADAHEFIERLPDKYETVLGHHGTRLSGGQQQRISLARAIIRDPRILILDEATNALDSISEQWIQETLDKLRENRTVIMIAHRLSTIERADQIIVLEKGRVVESGKLAELVKAGGLFAKLYHLQHRPSLVHDG
jgi:subfamily B ATP-binding cassette protein MsbA